MSLTPFQKEKYIKTISLLDIGENGQEKLLSSSILIVGVGGLGNLILSQLVSFGVGNIGIIDNDVIHESNLPRQILYKEKDLNKSKVEVAYQRNKEKNADVLINTYNCRLTKDNAASIFQGYDIIVDATDNFETKFLINDICVELHKPFVHGGVSEYQGQVFTYLPTYNKDFKSIFDTLPNDKDIDTSIGIYPLAPSLIATYVSDQVIKVLLNLDGVLKEELLIIDLKSLFIKKIKI